MNLFWLFAFLLAFAWMVHTYLGYPLILAWQRRRQQRRAVPRPPAEPLTDEQLPDVAIVIVARHAADLIGRKLRSCLDANYPADRLRVVLAIDGPDEATARAAEAIDDARITVLRNAEHRGKSATLNDAIATCQQPVLILTDARQRLDPDAIRHLVTALMHDPSRAAISGELQLEVGDGDFVGQGLDAYWRYEKWLRRTESEVASTIGATGALYAIRRCAFRPIPNQTILDDVLIPMQMVMDGHRVGFEARAVAYDQASVSMAQEKRRKIRTLAGNFQLLQLCPALLNPWRNPAFFGFFSHKFCRLLTPLALLVMLLASLALASGSVLFTLLLVAELTVITLAILARVWPASRRWPLVRLSSTFIEMHWFIVLGFIEFLRNRNLHRWSNEASQQGKAAQQAATGTQPLRVLYVVSLFPCWSETFIVREILGLLKQGVDIRIVSLKAACEPLVQPDARALLDRVRYAPGTLASLHIVLPQLLLHPWQSAGELWPLCRSLWRRPAELAKSVVSWWRTLAIMPQVRDFAPDHIHAHWATYPSTAARIFANRLGRPWSFTGHAHDIFIHDQDLSNKLCQADFSVTISEYNRRQLSRRMPAQLHERLAVVHCGVVTEDLPFNATGHAPRQIIAVGRLDPIKGFRYLIEACALLHRQGVEFQCELIGDGPLRAELQAAINQAGLGAHVHLLGALPQEEVRSRIAKATVFALPSVQLADGNADGIPVALMETMASGTVAVSTRVSGIPELIQDDENGLLVEPGRADQLADAIRRLLDDPALRARLALAARQRIVEDFEADIEAGKLLARMLALQPASRQAALARTAGHGQSLVPSSDSSTAAAPQGDAQAATTGTPSAQAGAARIMLVTDEMEVGGSQRQIVQLASGLKARGIECTVVYFRNPSFLLDTLQQAGVPARLVAKQHRVDPAFLRQLRQEIRAWQPDVLHCFSFTAELWGALACRLLPRAQRPALVSSVRGTYEWYSPKQWRLKRWVSQQSAGIVSNARMGAEYAAAQMNWPISAFTIIANGVESPKPDLAAAAALRSQYLPGPAGAAPDSQHTAATSATAGDRHQSTAPDATGQPDDAGHLLLFVGRLVEHKNLPRLLQAFARLLQQHPATRLLLAGSGPMEQTLQQQIQELALGERAILLGERHDVAELMSAADIIVLPSLREGLSNVILEAMALGRPVISTHAGGTPEIIEDGVNGLLVDPKDTSALCAAMHTLLDDPERCKQLGRNARQRVLEHYSPQAMVNAMCKEYQRVSQR